MTSPYYTPTGNPPAQSRGTSPTVRAEFSLLDAGFQKLPTPAQVWSSAANYVSDTGTANAYVVTLNALVTTLTAGLEVSFKAKTANTGASTLTVTGIGTAAIVGPDGVTPLSANAITTGMIVDVRYDGTNFQFRSGMLAGTQSPSAIQQQLYTAFTTTGTSSAFVLTPTPALPAYLNCSFSITFHAACAANPTLNISGLGARNLVKLSPAGTYVNLASGDIQTGVVMRVTSLGGSLVVSDFSTQGRLIGVQVIAATGTYTPTAGTTSVVVELGGGGGAGGGAAATGAGQVSAGTGGSAGGYARSRLTTGFSGVTVTVGAGGTGSAGGAGANGGTSSFGAVFSATGGAGGALGTAVGGGTVTFVRPAVGGAGSGGNLVNATGQPGGHSLYINGTALSGFGGASVFGGGGVAVQDTNGGVAATSFGAGGSGGSLLASNAAAAGGSGAQGICIIWEYA